MIDFKKLKGEAKAIYFETKKEMEDFLNECDKEDICWSTGSKASCFVPFDKYDKTCIIIEQSGLEYCDFDFYKEKGYEVINYKHLVTIAQESLIDINRIVRNKKTTIVFWKDDTKTIVRLGENQEESQEMAILWAYFEKHSGLSKTRAHKTMEEIINNIYVQSSSKSEYKAKHERKEKNDK